MTYRCSVLILVIVSVLFCCVTNSYVLCICLAISSVCYYVYQIAFVVRPTPQKMRMCSRSILIHSLRVTYVLQRCNSTINGDTPPNILLSHFTLVGFMLFIQLSVVTRSRYCVPSADALCEPCMTALRILATVGSISSL
jgi:hypothetical protein